MQLGTAEVISRTSGALLLSAIQASVADLGASDARSGDAALESAVGSRSLTSANALAGG